MRRLVGSCIVLLVLGSPVLAAPLAAGAAPVGATRVVASSVQNLQAQARSLAMRVDTLNTKLSILSEEYDQAENGATILGREIHVDASALSTAQLRVESDYTSLRRQAVNAYVTAGSNTGISFALSSSPNTIPLQQTYLKAASGNLVTSVSTLQISEHELSVKRATLDHADLAAEATANTIAHARASSLGLEDQLRATLAGVNGQLSAALAQQEASEQAAAAQAAAASASQAAAAGGAAPQPSATLTDDPASGNSGTPGSTSSPGGSGNGAAAVQAAESAEGVPYVWGGASLSGFDCSGLAMWAWAHAGVSLPHSAQDQYDSIEHVSMSDLEPGDLIFYADGGYVYHVIMYVGGGQAIQAENFGTVVQITPVWPGAFAAGRP